MVQDLLQTIATFCGLGELFNIPVVLDTDDNIEGVRPYNPGYRGAFVAKNGPIELSLDLLNSLHKRWVMYLSSLTVQDLERTYYHPENKKISKLKEVIGLYAWHGDHHLAHITETKKLNNW